MTDLEQAPDILGEIPGFRAWHVHSSVLTGVWLMSMNGTLWPRDHYLRADCLGATTCRQGGPVPGEGCSCGIYAARDRVELMDQWGYNRQPGAVIGEVGLAGRVIRGTKAHRAARARPVHLWVAYTDWKLAAALRDAYKVPVELTNVLTEGRTRHEHRTARVPGGR